MPDGYVIAARHLDPHGAIPALRKRICRIIAYDVNVAQFIGDLMGEARHVVYRLRIIDRAAARFGDVGHEVSSAAPVSIARIAPVHRLWGEVSSIISFVGLE